MRAMMLAAGTSLVLMAMPALAGGCCQDRGAEGTQSAASATTMAAMSSAQLAARAAQVRLELHGLDYSEFSGTEVTLAKEAEYRTLLHEYDVVRHAELEALGRLTKAPTALRVAQVSTQKPVR